MATISGHEVVGTRLVGALPTADLVALWGRSPRRSSSAASSSSIAISSRRGPASSTACGSSSIPTSASRCSASCCCTCSAIRCSGSRRRSSTSSRTCSTREDRARFMQVLHDYEFEAAGFGMQLLREVGVTAPGPVVQRFRRDRLALRRAVLRDRPAARLEDVRRQRLPAARAAADSAARRTGRSRCGSRSDRTWLDDRESPVRAPRLPTLLMYPRTDHATRRRPGSPQAVQRHHRRRRRELRGRGGEIFGLLGPNGAGKTTTRRMRDRPARAGRAARSRSAGSTPGGGRGR